MAMHLAKLHEELRRIEEVFPLVVLMLYSGYTHVVEYRTHVSNFVSSLADEARMPYAAAMESQIDALRNRAKSIDWALESMLARPRNDRDTVRIGRYRIWPNSSKSSSGAASPLGSGDGGRSSSRH